MDEALRYLSIGIIITLPTIGVGIGQGIIYRAALRAIDQQPAADNIIRRIAIIALTLTETAELLAVIMTIILIMQGTTSIHLPYLGIMLTLAIPCFIVGIVSALPAVAALNAAARQPFLGDKILQLLLISLSIIQTPAIFGFIIALLIQSQLHVNLTSPDAFRLLCSGLTFGLGTIGPLIGLGLFSRQSLTAVGLNRDIFDRLRTFTFISQALIEAPIIFALVTSLTIAFATSSADPLLNNTLFLTAACAMGFSTLSAGINSGKTAASAAQMMATEPHMYQPLSRMSLITQTLIDTSVIYGMIIAFIIILIG